MALNSTLKQKKPLKRKKTLSSNKALKRKISLSSNGLNKNKKSKQANAHDINQTVKKRVFERDNGACVVCGNTINVMPNAHFIPRSKGGMGVEKNIVTLCSNLTENRCHHKMDNGRNSEQSETKMKVEKYLKEKYVSWKKEDVIYNNK